MFNSEWSCPVHSRSLPCSFVSNLRLPALRNSSETGSGSPPKYFRTISSQRQFSSPPPSIHFLNERVSGGRRALWRRRATGVLCSSLGQTLNEEFLSRQSLTLLLIHTKKCRFMETRVSEISQFFVAPPCMFPLSVRALPCTVLSTNTSSLV